MQLFFFGQVMMMQSKFRTGVFRLFVTTISSFFISISFKQLYSISYAYVRTWLGFLANLLVFLNYRHMDALGRD